MLPLLLLCHFVALFLSLLFSSSASCFYFLDYFDVNIHFVSWCFFLSLSSCSFFLLQVFHFYHFFSFYSLCVQNIYTSFYWKSHFAASPVINSKFTVSKLPVTPSFSSAATFIDFPSLCHLDINTFSLHSSVHLMIICLIKMI